MSVMRPKIALSKTSHGVATTIEETFVNREGGRLVRAAVIKRMNNAGARPKGERRLLEPTLQGSSSFIFDDSGGKRFRRKRKIVAQPNRAADKVYIAAECAGRDIERVLGNEPARRYERAFPAIKCLRKSERVDKVGCLT